VNSSASLNPAESKIFSAKRTTSRGPLREGGQYAKAVGMLEHFVVAYRHRGRFVEARQKLGETPGTAGNIEKQRAWQREIVVPIAPPVRAAPIARISPRRHSSRWRHPRAMNTAASLVLPLKTSLARSAKLWKLRSADTRPPRTTRVAEVTGGHVRNCRKSTASSAGHHEVERPKLRRTSWMNTTRCSKKGVPVRGAGHRRTRSTPSACATTSMTKA
jgi:hypothetical protein